MSVAAKAVAGRFPDELGLETVCSTRLIAELMLDYVTTGVNRAHPEPAATAAAAAAAPAKAE